MQERLQKIIARAGIASRRHAEQLILSGQVRVNGKTVRELGTKADPAADTPPTIGTNSVCAPAGRKIFATSFSANATPSKKSNVSPSARSPWKASPAAATASSAPKKWPP